MPIATLSDERRLPASHRFDPHTSKAWFDLLQHTALPAGSTVTFHAVGPEEAPDACRIPLLRLADSPHRLQSLATYYSPLFEPVGIGSLDPARLSACFRMLRRHAGAAEIRLAPLDPETPLFAIMQCALRDAGWLTGTYFCFGNWYATIDRPGFDAYFGSLPSRVRNTVKRARSKLQQDGSFRIDVQTADDARLPQAVADFVSVYEHSWKQPEPYPAFIPALCSLAAREGWLRLGVLHLDGRPVAAQLWLVAAGKAHIVKLAYREDYRRHTVGTVLTAHLMRHAIDVDGVEEIDYLIGDDDYKRDWTPRRRERHGIIAFNPRTLRGCLAAAHHFGGRTLRRVQHLISPVSDSNHA